MDTPTSPLEHPDRELLEDLTAGALVPARRAVLEAHLEHCRPCRERTGRLARTGGRFLASANPAALPTPDLWSRIEAALPEPETAPDPFGDLPVPAASRDELRLSTPLRWEPLGPGRFARLAADPQADYLLFLVETPAGEVFPHHRHVGGEDLVILQGGLTDEAGHMGLGDYRTYGPGTAHAPVMDPGEVCMALCFIRGGLDFG